MSYHNFISIPWFMVTFLMGAVGRMNLAYSTAVNRRAATLMKASDVSPRPWHIITVAVWADCWHERLAKPVLGVLCCVVDLLQLNLEIGLFLDLAAMAF